MNKYTEADYINAHKGIIEDMADKCIDHWHNHTDPLYARVYRNIASMLEDLRDVNDNVENVNVWVSAANEEHTHTRSKS